MFRPKPIPPQAGQESVWDYPRPPRLELSPKHLQIIFNGVTIAETHRSYRVLETSHPPCYYLPPEDIRQEYLQATKERSFCEWKGVAGYYTVTVGDKQAINAAWYYPDPTPPFAAMKNYVAFYAVKMEACYVDGELVRPQLGNFYGGWITADIVGPFKGEASTLGFF